MIFDHNSNFNITAIIVFDFILVTWHCFEFEIKITDYTSFFLLYHTYTEQDGKKHPHMALSFSFVFILNQTSRIIWVHIFCFNFPLTSLSSFFLVFEHFGEFCTSSTWSTHTVQPVQSVECIYSSNRCIISRNYFSFF